MLSILKRQTRFGTNLCAYNARRLQSWKPFPGSQEKTNEAVDPPDFSSIQTMEKILTILHDAEYNTTKLNKTISTQTKSQVDPDYDRLGRALFEYALVRHLNDQEVFRLESDKPEVTYKLLIEHASKTYDKMTNSFFLRNEINHNDSLTRYQAIALYFLQEKSHCLRRLGKDIRFITKDLNFLASSRADNWVFPNIKVPPPHRFDANNPYLISKALNTKGKYNVLSFLPNDEGFLTNFFSRYQISKSHSSVDVSKLRDVMAAYELEGELLFEVLTRASTVSQKDSEALSESMDKFLFDNHSLKAVVAKRSKMLTRLYSLNNYKISLAKSSLYKITEDAQVLDFMAKQFDRFFALYYRINAGDADAWLNKLLLHCSTTPVIDKEVSKECLDHFSDLKDETLLLSNKFKWKRLLNN